MSRTKSRLGDATIPTPWPLILAHVTVWLLASWAYYDVVYVGNLSFLNQRYLDFEWVESAVRGVGNRSYVFGRYAELDVNLHILIFFISFIIEGLGVIRYKGRYITKRDLRKNMYLLLFLLFIIYAYVYLGPDSPRPVDYSSVWKWLDVTYFGRVVELFSWVIISREIVVSTCVIILRSMSAVLGVRV